jgi:hypothetical protein
VSNKTLPQSKSADDTKRLFIQRANEQWQTDFKKALAAAREAERRGEFTSLAPPQQLIPFGDWDYYYTKGRSAQWHPNSGQNFKAVTVPEGFVTDLASVPQWVWSSGLRPEGRYAYAAIIHDYLYWMQDRPREDADKIFLHAMEDSKVDRVLRERIYDAVNLAGGSAWDRNAKLKLEGERRLLREFPSDFTISWDEWKRRPGVLRD